MTIPKIIHQIYWDFSGKNKPPPPTWRKFSKSWKNCFPDWEYILWNEKSCEKFLKTYYPWFLSKYNGYNLPIQKTDVMRPFILYHYGGIYADMDYECFYNFETYLTDNPSPIYIVEETGFLPVLFQNSLMISIKLHPFWMYVIKEFYRRPTLLTKILPSGMCVLSSTGPLLLQNVYNKTNIKSDIFILPKKQFNPTLDILKKKKCIENECFAIHHHNGSWIFSENFRKFKNNWFVSAESASKVFGPKKVITIALLVIIIIVSFIVFRKCFSKVKKT